MFAKNEKPSFATPFTIYITQKWPRGSKLIIPIKERKCEIEFNHRGVNLIIVINFFWKRKTCERTFERGRKHC